MDESGIPSKKQQSWGALISIVVIMLMIIVGAFWAWEKRAAEREQLDRAAGELESAEVLQTATTTL